MSSSQRLWVRYLCDVVFYLRTQEYIVGVVTVNTFCTTNAILLV